jgi:hypothetical protein
MSDVQVAQSDHRGVLFCCRRLSHQLARLLSKPLSSAAAALTASNAQQNEIDDSQQNGRHRRCLRGATCGRLLAARWALSFPSHPSTSTRTSVSVCFCACECAQIHCDDSLTRDRDPEKLAKRARAASGRDPHAHLQSRARR